jgi:serine/threonine protein kinase
VFIRWDAKEYIQLEYYPHGNLKDYIHQDRATMTKINLKHWASQMIESVAYIHAKGVRHSDLRLDQWLVDADLNARLSDFNASGYDDQPDLGLKGRPTLGFEIASHFLPRDPDADNTVESDLFALGSALYELVTGQKPYEDCSEESLEALFGERKFPITGSLLLGDIILGCWGGRFDSANGILHYAKRNRLLD